MSVLKSKLTDIDINEKLSYPDFVFLGVNDHEGRIALVGICDNGKKKFVRFFTFSVMFETVKMKLYFCIVD